MFELLVAGSKEEGVCLCLGLDAADDLIARGVSDDELDTASKRKETIKNE